MQARRQDLAAGGAKNQKEGPKTSRGGTFFKYCIGCMQQPGVQTWNGGAQTSNGGPGTTAPAGDGPSSIQHSYLEALLWKNIYHFLERCRNTNNVWLRALMQSYCLYSSLFFEHYNRIWLSDWVLGRCSVCRLRACACHNTSVLYLVLAKVGLSVLLWM